MSIHVVSALFDVALSHITSITHISYFGSQLKQTVALLTAAPISITTVEAMSWNSSSGSWNSAYDPKAWNKNGKYDKEEHRDQWKSQTLPRAQNGGEASSQCAKTEQCAGKQWTNGADNTNVCPTQLVAQQPSGCSQHSGSSSATW